MSSFYNGGNSGRTRMKSKVFLNVYDLNPSNDYLLPLGLGFFHSGIEINGREYSFGSGGGSGGIFDHPPRQAPNARFRCQIELGSYDGGTDELNRALDVLRSDSGSNGVGGFGSGNHYNLVRRNCNHFCNALAWQLLRKPIPAWVNRVAAIGDCCSCLLPKQLLEGSPVEGTNDGATKSFAVPTHASMNRGGKTAASAAATKSFDAFAGKGQSLGGGGGGGGSSSTSSNNSSNKGNTGLFSRFSSSSTATTTTMSSSSTDELTDRREKARLAALARLERNNQQSSPQ